MAGGDAVATSHTPPETLFEDGMTALDHALTLIKAWEGCRLTAYPDPGTGGDPWTIGWGSTGPDIRKGTVWTQAQADDRLASDVQKFMRGVQKAVGVDLKPNQMGALTSLAYNIGLRAFGTSTLVRMIKSGDIEGASKQFLRWNRAGGRVMKGLANRRAHEKQVFDGAFRRVRSSVTSTETIAD